jgi:hypothetical protein
MDRIDLGRAFKAPFEDKEWVVKTLLGFLWGLLVVTIPAVIGAEHGELRSCPTLRQRHACRPVDVLRSIVRASPVEQRPVNERLGSVPVDSDLGCGFLLEGATDRGAS